MGMSPRLLRPRATGFSPKNISGLALWLDAADSSTLYTTDAGPVTAVSAPTDISGCIGWYDAADASTLFAADTGSTLATTTVGRWANKGTLGSSLDLLQSGSTARPSISSNALNGLPIVLFDGQNDFLRSGGSVTLSANLTYLLVFRFASDYVSGGPRIVDGGDGSPVRSGEFYQNFSNTSVALFQGTTNGSTTLPSNALRTYGVWLAQYSTTDARIGYNGVSSFASGTTSGANGAGTRITMAATGTATPSEFGNIQMAELCVFNSTLSVANRARVEAYLAAKWGISGVHTPATATSDPVGYWADKSGNGRNATQTDGTRRPLISTTTNQQNGRNGLTYDNVNDTLSLGNISAAFSSSEGSGFFVYRLSGADNVYTILSTRANSAVTQTQSAGVTLSYNGAWRTTRLNGLATRLPFATGDLAVVHTLQSSSSIYELRNNSALVTSTTGDWNAGNNYELGGDSSGNTYTAAMIYETLLYSRVLPESERRRVEQYLATKWGITLAPQVANLDAQDWINRVYLNGGTVSTSTAAAVNAFCNAIDAGVGGVSMRDRFYRLNLFCGNNLSACQVPLYRGASVSGTQYGNTIDISAGSPSFLTTDYAEGTGLTGNGSSKYLQTGVRPDQLPAGWEYNLHISAYRRTAGNDQALLGSYYYDTAIAANRHNYEIAQNSIAMGTTGGPASPAFPAYPFLQTGVRSSASIAVAYVNSTAGTTYTVPISAFATNTPFAVFSRNLITGAPPSTGYTTTYWTSSTLGGYSIGAAMTGPQVSAYSSAMQTFQAALGR